MNTTTIENQVIKKIKPDQGTDKGKEDWVECTLREVVTYSKGKKPKILKVNPEKGIEIPYINIKAFEKGIYSEYTDGVKCNLCNDGDLLMVWDGARAGLTGKAKKGAVGSTLMKIEPINNVINKEYLYYFLLSKYTLLNTNPRGVGIPHVEPSLLWNSTFIIYNSSFQRAIVRKIEELFSSLDSGIADLKKAQEQLVIYRQAVLKKAFEGDWKRVKLGSLIIEGPTNGMYKPKSFYGRGTPILRIDGFYDGKISCWNSLKKLELEASELETYGLKNNDIVINRVNSMPYVGKSAIVKNLVENCVFESNIMRLRIDNDIISSIFLIKYLISPNGFKELQKNVKHAVNQSSINQTDVKNAIIPVPRLIEQHTIVREIESRLSVCDKVEESLTESLEKAQALRQSILKKAFEGKLLSEAEIEQCKREKDYEPASVLLERIKAEKEKK